MRIRNTFYLVCFISLIGHSMLLASENENHIRNLDSILKRSIGRSSLENILTSNSFFDKNSAPVNDLKKRNDGVKTESSLLREKIHELADNLLKLTPSSLNKLSNKPFYQTDLSSILNTENDLEEQEIIKKSQALGIIGSDKIVYKNTSYSTIFTKTSTKMTKIPEESSEKEKFEKEQDDEYDDEEDEDEVNDEKSIAKEEKKKVRKKQKKNKKDVNQKSDIQKDENSRLSSKQLKQIYKFLRNKEKNKNQEESNSVNDLLNSIMSSPNHEIHLKLRDSLSAKAANDALLNWHSKAPFASLNELEEMYNKFYEFYYDYFDIYSGHSSVGHHLGHYHHPHHDHHHLNLLDFLTSKKEKSENKNLKNSLFNKIISSNYLIKKNPWNDYHHVHNLPDYHHLHHHHDINLDQDPYFSKLKAKINYYISNDLTPPSYLLNEFNRLRYEKIEYDHLNNYDSDHYLDNYEDHFHNNPYPHHHYHYSQHPIYDGYGRRIIYTTGQIERFPSSPNSQLNENLPKQPIVCMNYPDHSSEGFKSFISVESCNQPSFLGSNGVPLFGNGCVFRYICELGYQPIGGITSSIKCNNGFWTARAICIKQNVNPSSINSNPANNLNSQMQSSQTFMQNPSFQKTLLKRSDSNQNSVDSESNLKNRVKRENFAHNFNDGKNFDSLFETSIVNSKDSIDSNELEFNLTEKENERRKDILNKLQEKEKSTQSKKQSTIPTTTRLKETKTTLKKSNLKKLIQKKEKQNEIDSNPLINWSSIMDSDSEKTIYESFYELLENSANKMNTNIELLDINKI